MAQKHKSVQPVSGRYVFTFVSDYRGEAEVRHYRTLGDMARAVFSILSAHHERNWLSTVARPGLTTAEAHSARGRPLRIDELEAYGRRLRLEDLRLRRYAGANQHVWRSGPVAGVHKGGYGRHYRRPETMAERRAASFFSEEGEIGPRPARRESNVPNAWDDYGRCVQHCWKSQRKGRKAWDRG